MRANEMPERIWAAPWHSRSDADAGVWQSNDPGNKVYALEYLRSDLCPEGPVRGLLQRAVDLIDGDLMGRDWKRACRSFVADAKAALASREAHHPQPSETVTEAGDDFVQAKRLFVGGGWGGES